MDDDKSRAELKKRIVDLENQVADLQNARIRDHKSDQILRQLFDHMKEGVGIYRAIDSGQIFEFVDFNKAGLDIGDKTREEVIGRNALDVFPGLEEIGLIDCFRRVHLTGRPEHHPLSRYNDGKLDQFVENYVFAIPPDLVVSIYEETTQKRRLEIEKQEMIEVLQSKLAEIKALRGLVPICSICKSIRDDKGYWNQLEKYLFEHTEAKLSHGICPKCAEQHYPQFARSKKT